MSNQSASALFLPHNAQEFENDMRALIVKHMGLGEGNPTGWVVKAVCEAYQRGFGAGFAVGQRTPIAPSPATRVYPQAQALTLAERVDGSEANLRLNRRRK